MFKLHRDVLIILLSIILASFGSVVPVVFQITTWNVLSVIAYFVIIAALVFALIQTVRGLQAIDKKEDKEQKEQLKKIISDAVNVAVKDAINEIKNNKVEK